MLGRMVPQLPASTLPLTGRAGEGCECDAGVSGPYPFTLPAVSPRMM